MLLAIAGWIEVWHLAVGALLAGVYWAAELPLRRTLLGSTVPPERLVPAMALDTTTNNLTKMMGPLLGGIVLQLVGLAGTFGFAVLMQAITFTLVRQIEAGKRAPRRHAGFLRNLREGLAMARHNPIVLLALGHSLVFNLFGVNTVAMALVMGGTAALLPALGLAAHTRTALISSGVTFAGYQALADWYIPTRWIDYLMGCGLALLVCVLFQPTSALRRFQQLAAEAIRTGQPPPPELAALLPSAREEAAWLGQARSLEALLGALPPPPTPAPPA